MSTASTASNSAITVRAARSAADRRRFIRFPWRVYGGIDAWVPPLISDFKKKLDTVRNPFYKHAEIELFLARRNGSPAGTVAAIIDHHYNSFHDERTGFFGFFEAVNDDAVAGALIDAAAQWVAARPRQPVDRRIDGHPAGRLRPAPRHHDVL